MIIAITLLMLFFHIIFIFALKIKDNSIADIAWGIGFIVVDISLISQSKNINAPQYIISLLILIWGLRLGGYIYFRKRKNGEDFRYLEFRKKWGSHHIIGSYFQVFMIQMILLLLISTPLFLVFEKNNSLSAYTFIGMIIATTGFIIEFVSDFQMHKFKKNPLNKLKIIQCGLWQYSRHPNYFGESLFWWGIACIVYPLSSHFLWLISPIIITVLVRYVSGVPLLEKKYEGNPEFQLYSKKTSCFLPLPTKKG